MAHIILSENSQELNAIYGKVQTPIASFLEKRIEAFERASIAKKIFIERKSTNWAESYTGITAMDDFEPSVENGAYPQNGFTESYLQTIPNVTWKSQFAISREVMDDAKLMDMKRRPQNFVSAYYRTRERFFAALLGGALSSKTSIKVKDMEFSTKSADGVCMFAQNHKPKVSGGNQCNAFTDAFSASALTAAATRMQNMKGDNGETLGLEPDTIVIPNDAELKAEVFGVLGAYHDPDTAAGNKYNFNFGNWNVWVWPYLNDFIGTAKPWVLIDSAYNEQADGGVAQNRVDLEIRSVLADNDANVWKGYARFGGGFVDFRAMLAGGMTSGATL